MPAGSLSCRLARVGGLCSARVSGAVLATLLFFLLPAAANAYTLVLRGGRHVTVPEDFKVTPAAVVYEAAPGLSVTVWLTNVDVAATERANAEPAGSFARRIKREPEGAGAKQTQAPEVLKTGRGPVRRVVTDRDLEPFRLRREAQEEEYERTRRERGMPSKQEWQRRVEEEDRKLREWARQMREERREAELESLRSELAETRRGLNELSLRLSQQSADYVQAYVPPNYYPYSYAPPFQVISVFPFGHHRLLGRGAFGNPPYGHQWPQHPRPGYSFPTVINRPWTSGGLRQVPAPARPAPRR
jgi:hypothetical protein